MTSEMQEAATRTQHEAIRRSLRNAISLLQRENEINMGTINMVPSENALSPLAGLPLRMDYYNRYFFNQGLDDGEWHFRGGQAVGSVEVNLGVSALKRLSKANYVNIRPVSGMSAMTIVLLGLSTPKDGVIATVDPDSGGHYATAELANKLGRSTISFKIEAGEVDLEHLHTILTTQSIQLVYFDLQNTLREIEISKAVRLIKETSPETLVHVDISHTMGLIFGNVHPNPLEMGADSMGGSTHKTFPGPQKGVLLTNDESIAERFREAQFYSLSSHHFAETLALAISACEFEIFGAAYAQATVRNAHAFAGFLSKAGFDVIESVPGFTRTHQIWVKHNDGHSFAASLANVGIRTNVQDALPGIATPALRIGVNEVTFKGANVADMQTLAEVYELTSSGNTAEARDRTKGLDNFSGRVPHFYRA